MSDEEKVTEKKSKPKPKKNIERLKKIKKKREQGVSMRAMAAAGAAVAVVTVVAVAGGMIKNLQDNREETMRVETVAASLETTAPPETITQAEVKSIVLETTLSDEEIASMEYEAKVQGILDGYANLGIAAVSGYLNIRKTPESFGEVVGKLPSGGACEVVDTQTDGWYKISSGGVTGYVSSQYIYTGEQARENAAANITERAVIQAEKLNVRASASPDAEVVGQALKNERYTVKGQQDGWLQIDSGFISSEYAEVRLALNEARKQDMRTTVLSLYDNLGVSNVTNYLNVRDKPDEKDGKIIAKLPSNAGCDILDSSEEGWLKIRSGKITGYVKSEFILTGQQAQDKAMEVAELMAFTNTDGVNVRTEPNTDSSIWTQLAMNENYHVSNQQDGWVGIELDDTVAYISSDLVEVKYGLNEAVKYTPVVVADSTASKGTKTSKPKTTTTSKPNSSSGKVNDGAAGSNAGGVSSRRAEIANYAVQFVGNPYVYGGTSLTNGADCS
ncbi:MAG: SH3 domain-containing protein, partial [Lachnospiraceae bacterium]|nr:SH3 domain-containing protein [Lachnospiraceae bacterium]